MRLAQKGGNDRVYTPQPLAHAIVQHFKPGGRLLEPCRGKGAFYDEMITLTGRTDWCEKDDGRDFLTTTFNGQYDWIITNPPWSQLRAFLRKSMAVADNVVFLCLTNALFYNGRQDDIAAAGFGVREIARVKQPPKPWPQTGFMLSANWLQRGWAGPITTSILEWEKNWI
jgi:hypothetical protein